MAERESGGRTRVLCPSVFPPSATGPYSDETGYGWSGPLRCVLATHDHDVHLNSGIKWGGAPGVPAGTTCGTFGCERFAVLHVRRPHEWISGFYCAEHGADGVPALENADEVRP